jgi:hypothetical protein
MQTWLAFDRMISPVSLRQKFREPDPREKLIALEQGSG